MRKAKQPKEIDYYFVPKKNGYGLTEYICIIKLKGMEFSNGPRYKTDWCYDLNIKLSEFDLKIKH